MRQLAAFDRAARSYDWAQPGRRYRLSSHDETRCMEGECGGIIDEGLVTYLGSEFAYADRWLGDIYDHRFARGQDILTFGDGEYTLSLDVPKEWDHADHPQ